MCPWGRHEVSTRREVVVGGKLKSRKDRGCCHSKKQTGFPVKKAGVPILAPLLKNTPMT